MTPFSHVLMTMSPFNWMKNSSLSTLWKSFRAFGPPDHHREEVAAAVEVLVPDRRLEIRAMRFRPFHEVQRAADRSVCFESVWFKRGLGVGGGTSGVGRGIGHGKVSGADEFRELMTSGLAGRRFVPTVQGSEHTEVDASPFHRVPSQR